MTINIATEQCDCPIPMQIGWAQDGWDGMAGGDVAAEFAAAAPEGYALWSGPSRGDIRLAEGADTVKVIKNSMGGCLIAEYKKL